MTVAWPKRKQGNQRTRSRNVLDVKTSAAQTHRRRLRILFQGGGATLAVALTLAVCWRSGEFLLNRMLYQNKAYAIQTLDIQTDGVLAPEQIRRWAGVNLNDNLFELDLARIRRDLDLVPAIQSAAVERVLPQTLRIHVVEREPVAQVMTTMMHEGIEARSVVFLLDAEGMVMLPLESRQRAVPLTAAERYPVITGASLAQLSPGRRIESPGIRSALRLVSAFEHSPMAGMVELLRVDVSSPDVLVVTTDQQSEVALRVSDLERELGRWRLIHDLGVQQGQKVGSLDLSVSENIPLKWLESVSVPPSSTPKIKKTSPYKKRHV